MISFRGVSVEYDAAKGPLTVVDRVDLDIEKGQFVCFVGPSGCGKTTLLNTVVGLVRPTGGAVEYDGGTVEGVNRRVGYVTQSETLFPWRTTQANVGVALEVARVPDAEIRQRVDRYLKLVGLERFRHHYPHQLSGGMRRRAALARTWIYEPETILMDEPFGALDAQLKLVMQKQLLELWERIRCTVIFVTHDLAEAVTLADRIVVFSARPARVKAIRDVPIPRPRDPFRVHFSPECQKICEELWATLESELLVGGES